MRIPREIEDAIRTIVVQDVEQLERVQDVMARGQVRLRREAGMAQTIGEIAARILRAPAIRRVRGRLRTMTTREAVDAAATLRVIYEREGPGWVQDLRAVDHPALAIMPNAEQVGGELSEQLGRYPVSRALNEVLTTRIAAGGITY